jgi:hypothetical protein
MSCAPELPIPEGRARERLDITKLLSKRGESMTSVLVVSTQRGQNIPVPNPVPFWEMSGGRRSVRWLAFPAGSSLSTRQPNNVHLRKVFPDELHCRQFVGVGLPRCRPALMSCQVGSGHISETASDQDVGSKMLLSPDAGETDARR